MDEANVILGCRKGDRVAQHELYRRTIERILRTIGRIAGNEADTFDIAQDVYLKAFTRIAQFDGRSSIATWLFRLAVNETLQWKRRSARLPRLALGESVVSQNNGASEREIIHRTDIQYALSRLDPLDRAVLVLRYQEGLDYRAIAEILDCPPGTVASRLNRAREKMRAALEKGYGTLEETEHSAHPKDVAITETRGVVPSPAAELDSGMVSTS